MDDKPNGKCESVGKRPARRNGRASEDREAQRSVMRIYSIGFSAM